MAMRGFENGIFTVLSNTVIGALEKAGAITNGILDGAASVYDAAVAGVGNVIDGAKGLVPSISFGGPSQEVEVAKVQAPEIAPPVRQNHYADMADLGDLAPPQFNVLPAASRSTQIG